MDIKFCVSCWEGYIFTKLDDLLTCISATCPQEGCNIVVSEEVFYKFLDSKPSLQLPYKKAIINNFTDFNLDLRWCPRPNCGICVLSPGHSMKEIQCECSYVFCFKCGLEGHRPCDCQTIDIWTKKNNSESENVKWLIANTKQCPECHKYIEKNQGCNHMTCRKEAGGCGYEFCWICLGEWKPHGSSYYQCTKFDKDKVTSKEEMVKNAKLELEKYVFYFDRFMNHQRSQALGVKLKEILKEYSQQFREVKNQNYDELKFMEDAADTIIHARRCLKNTYVFGFYMIDCNEKNLFEHHQYLLDRDTDKLHGMMEGDIIKKLLQIETFDEFNKSFISFRNDVINLLSCINKYKDNILNEIEKNLLDKIDYKLIYK